MSILSGSPFSTVPISGTEGAAAPLDDFIPTQMTAIDDGTALYGDPDTEEGFDYQGIQQAPLADFVAAPDAEIKTFEGFFDVVVDDDLDFYPTDFATGPPDQDDQYEFPTWVDVYDDDEPITDGITASPLAFPDDETGQTTGGTSNNDWVDEDEPVTDGQISFALDDTPVSTDASILGTSLNDVIDEDEPLTDGNTSGPINQDDERSAQSIADLVDEDEPVTDGQLGSPLQDAPAPDTAITRTYLGDVVDADADDIPIEFCTSSPLDDGPFVPPPPAVTQTTTGSGAGIGSGDPGFVGRTLRLPEVIDESKRLRRLLVKRERKRREQEKRKRILLALIHSLGLLDD